MHNDIYDSCYPVRLLSTRIGRQLEEDEEIVENLLNIFDWSQALHAYRRDCNLTAEKLLDFA